VRVLTLFLSYPRARLCSFRINFEIAFGDIGYAARARDDEWE